MSILSSILILSGIFSDHAVLQRDMPVPIWGWAEPFQQVTVTIDGQTVAGLANDQGKFLIILPEHAAGGPYQLTISAGNETRQLNDICYGEIWIAGGQSNMEMPLTGFDRPLMSAEELAKLQFSSQVRMLRVRWNASTHRQEIIKDSWMRCDDSSNYPMISAQAVFFAQELSEKLGNIPVGILSSNWGGTVAETWMSREALEEIPAYRDSLAEYEAKISAPDYWYNLPEFSGTAMHQHFDELALRGNQNYKIQDLLDFLSARPNLLPENHHDQNLAAMNFDDSGWKTGNLPGMWSDTHRIQDLGIVWFRKDIEIPTTWIGKSLKLSLGAIDKQDITYFNGQQVGATGSGFDDSHWNTRRNYDVAGELVDSPRAVIAVRAYSFAFNGGMNGPAEAMYLKCPELNEQIPLAGSWKAHCSLSYASVPSMLLCPWQSNDSPISYCDAWNTGAFRPNSYHILFDNMIFPLIPYAVRGAIWNQGCSNLNQSDLFKDATVAVINDWRNHWHQPEFAFIQTLLAGYDNPANRPQLRLAQIEAAKETGTNFVSSFDLGDKDDLHPARKQELGQRTAAVALGAVYHQDIAWHGPEIKTWRWQDNDLIVECEFAEGLKADGNLPDGFEWLNEKGDATAITPEIHNNSLIFRNFPAEATVLRYGWEDYPNHANCRNEAGWPMVPFVHTPVCAHPVKE